MADINDNFHRHMGVYGICTADNCILVIRKVLGPYTGKYDLPGGRLEKMESLEQGIIRELREETGYTVRKLKNIGVCDFFVMWTLQDNTIEIYIILPFYMKLMLIQKRPRMPLNRLKDKIQKGLFGWTLMKSMVTIHRLWYCRQ